MWEKPGKDLNSAVEIKYDKNKDGKSELSARFVTCQL